MILGYTAMDKFGTRLMRALGLPTYLFAVTMFLFSPFDSVFQMVVFIFIPFAYEFFYVKTLVYRHLKNIAPPKFFFWCLSVLVIQLVSIFIIISIVGDGV
jgi:hypothetical protein